LASLKVETLLLEHIPITDNGLRHLQSIPLTGFYLDSTLITPRDQDATEGRNAAPVLSRAGVTNKALDELDQFPSFSTPMLVETKVTGARVRQFAEPHPNCTILYAKNGQLEKIGPKEPGE
jgi:hypothetical protein